MADEKVEERCQKKETLQAKMTSPERETETEGKNQVNSNQGWAEAMAKILENQLPLGKAPLLLKYKKVEKRKLEEKEEKSTKKLKSQERHAMLEKDHVKPDGSTMDYEKNLQRIATRGVVKLFNAVSKHQKEMESKLKSAPTEAKKSKVMESMSKSAFLDMLKSNSGKPRTKQESEQKDIKENKLNKNGSSSWSILRDDFMMGAKMRDWNLEDDSTRDKKKEKNTTNISDIDLENNVDFYEESGDESDNADDEDDYDNEDESAEG